MEWWFHDDICYSVCHLVRATFLGCNHLLGALTLSLGLFFLYLGCGPSETGIRGFSPLGF